MMIIDLTHTLIDSFPTNDREKTIIKKSAEYKKHGYNLEYFCMSSHVGTHLDSCSHISDSSENVSNIELNEVIGDGIALNYGEKNVIDYYQGLEYLDLKDKIVMIYTGYSDHITNKQYFTNHPVITESFCDFLIAKKIKLLCLDFYSVDRVPYLLHKKLFDNGIRIVENGTNFSAIINEKKFKVFAIPLKIQTSGSPIRLFAVI